MSAWSCPHGFGPGTNRGDCDACNQEFADRPSADAMTPDERAEEVRSLLHDLHSYRFSDIHGRIEALVGRPVWTHEFVTDTRLIEEARGAPHPSDLYGHLIESFQAVAGDKPVVIVRVDKP